MTVLSSSLKDIDFPIRLATGHEAIIQRVKQRLRTYIGEWVLDESIGIDFIRDVLNAKNDAERAARIEEVAYTIEGVRQATILSIKSVGERQGLIELEVITFDGTTEEQILIGIEQSIPGVGG